jgi:hypothetical protein
MVEEGGITHVRCTLSAAAPQELEVAPTATVTAGSAELSATSGHVEGDRTSRVGGDAVEQGTGAGLVVPHTNDITLLDLEFHLSDLVAVGESLALIEQLRYSELHLELAGKQIAACMS